MAGTDAIHAAARTQLTQSIRGDTAGPDAIHAAARALLSHPTDADAIREVCSVFDALHPSSTEAASSWYSKSVLESRAVPAAVELLNLRCASAPSDSCPLLGTILNFANEVPLHPALIDAEAPAAVLKALRHGMSSDQCRRSDIIGYCIPALRALIDDAAAARELASAESIRVLAAAGAAWRLSGDAKDPSDAAPPELSAQLCTIFARIARACSGSDSRTIAGLPTDTLVKAVVDAYLSEPSHAELAEDAVEALRHLIALQAEPINASVTSLRAAELVLPDALRRHGLKAPRLASHACTALQIWTVWAPAADPDSRRIALASAGAVKPLLHCVREYMSMPALVKAACDALAGLTRHAKAEVGLAKLAAPILVQVLHRFCEENRICRGVMISIASLCNSFAIQGAQIPARRIFADAGAADAIIALLQRRSADAATCGCDDCHQYSWRVAFDALACLGCEFKLRLRAGTDAIATLIGGLKRNLAFSEAREAGLPALAAFSHMLDAAPASCISSACEAAVAVLRSVCNLTDIAGAHTACGAVRLMAMDGGPKVQLALLSAGAAEVVAAIIVLHCAPSSASACPDEMCNSARLCLDGLVRNRCAGAADSTLPSTVRGYKPSQCCAKCAAKAEASAAAAEAAFLPLARAASARAIISAVRTRCRDSADFSVLANEVVWASMAVFIPYRTPDECKRYRSWAVAIAAQLLTRHSDSPAAVLGAALLLRDVATDSPKRGAVMVNMDVKALGDALRRHIADSEVCAALCAAVRNVGASLEFRKRLAHAGLAPHIVAALGRHTGLNSDAVFAACGALFALACEPANLPQLLEAGAAAATVAVLRAYTAEPEARIAWVGAGILEKLLSAAPRPLPPQMDAKAIVRALQAVTMSYADESELHRRVHKTAVVSLHLAMQRDACGARAAAALAAALMSACGVHATP